MDLTPRAQVRQQELDATRAVRRRAAVAAATDLFAQQGFHATAMADIARAAGVSLKALYDSFASKEALFEAVLADVGERFAGLMEPPTAADDPAAWLLDFVDRLVGLLADNSSALCLYSRGADGIPEALRSKGVNPFTGFMVRLAEMLATVIRDVQHVGSVDGADGADGIGPGGVDPDVLARAVLNLVIAEARHRLEAGRPVRGAGEDLKPILAAALAAPD